MIKKENLCSRCKKKPWICGVQYGKKVKRLVLLCDDCAFPDVVIKKNTAPKLNAWKTSG